MLQCFSGLYALFDKSSQKKPNNIHWPACHVKQLLLLRYLYLIDQNTNQGGPWGHGSLQTASEATEVRFDLRFNTSNLNYPDIYVHLTWNSLFSGLWGHSDLHMASEVTSDLEFELSDLKNLGSSASLASFVLYSTKCPEGRRQNRLVDSHCFACS